MQEESTTIPSAVDLMFVAHKLERIADHATNIAEHVVFVVKGIDVRHQQGRARQSIRVFGKKLRFGLAARRFGLRVGS
jgi:phosphate uptake regulator